MEDVDRETVTKAAMEWPLQMVEGQLVILW